MTKARFKCLAGNDKDGNRSRDSNMTTVKIKRMTDRVPR